MVVEVNLEECSGRGEGERRVEKRGGKKENVGGGIERWERGGRDQAK